MYHNKLQKIIPKNLLDSLSYFEYTTLLSFYIFSNNSLHYWVIEAGLGGEFDATNVIDKNLSLITAIGIDHEEFLGDNIKKIATTKINSVKNDAIILDGQQDDVLKIAKQHLQNIGKNLILSRDAISKEEEEEIKSISIPNFLQENLKLAISALKYNGIKNIDIKKFKNTPLIARAQKISSRITLDVGHNELAANALKKLFINKKIVLVYNCYSNKKYQNILKILQPIVKRLEIIKIDGDRVIEAKLLEESAKSLLIDVSYYKKTNSTDEYLFFGSFGVVQAYLDSKN
jgi:dihydrofolate synthase/folylpolyglutamate synthase